MGNTIKVFALVLTLSAIAVTQTISEKKTSEARENLQKEAVVFLRETLGDVNGMRSLENRISFTAELAGLMWFHDEREARAMYQGVIGDFRDLLTRYDAQMNALGITPDEGDGSLVPISFIMEPTEKGRVLRRFATAMGVRQQIAMTIAEHDADLAYGFYNDSLSAISNPEFRKQAENSDTHFETQLLSQIAENNPAKAAQYGAKSLGKRVTYQHIDLLKKIYGTDAEKGAEFGAALMSHLKNEKIDNSEFYVIQSLIEFGGQTLESSRKTGGKKPVYSQSELRDLVEILAQSILNRPENDPGNALSYLSIIQKYSPGRAAQIRAKFKSSNTRNANFNASSAYAVSSAANSNSFGYPKDYSNSNAMSNSGRYDSEMREREEREKAEQKLIEDVQSLATKPLPKEEREKIITQARKIIMQTPGRDKKVVALGMLASQVSKMGDKELAAEIMRDAEALVNPSPKNYQDFLLSWMLASGYATADPDKAFPLLEETIGRANDTLAAFIKVGEFIDVAEEMIQDGEVQVGAFGGQMVRGLTRELGLADTTIQVLAQADFAKTKTLTNRFDRAEIRVLAKMMVLRAILNPKAPAKPDVDIDAGPVPPEFEN
ncbi:MAG: hypothetical protein ABI857_06915 [Acidobacteriota bacterium]